jgi:tetratricopeptide (TPR) repeat protein
MYQPSADQLHLFRTAEQYEQKADVYQAVKLFRLLVKQAPEWLLPHQRLAAIYKKRQEWKAVVHYNKKAAVLDPGAQQYWWDLGIGTYAIGKKRQARRIWNKFGWTPDQLPKALSVQIRHSGIYELVWVKPINPVAGIIISIPHPQADRAFKDKILFDRNILGYHVANNQRLPIFQELDLLKRSYYVTFSGIIYDCKDEDLNTFAKLAQEQGMGFEIWSNAAYGRQLSQIERPAEFYAGNTTFTSQASELGVLIALSGKRTQQVKSLIKSWEVITLNTLSDLEQH